ncbi:hypothetical protein V866_003982 [Kwoniella sp. B9012]|uniref:Uncharacterized protein n=1 Tax=Kwoniella europaea PYCC6329 TaxID=1423913 RepID=A0AAX4KHK7_9TREE
MSTSIQDNTQSGETQPIEVVTKDGMRLISPSTAPPEDTSITHTDPYETKPARSFYNFDQIRQGMDNAPLNEAHLPPSEKAWSYFADEGRSKTLRHGFTDFVDSAHNKESTQKKKTVDILRSGRRGEGENSDIDQVMFRWGSRGARRILTEDDQSWNFEVDMGEELEYPRTRLISTRDATLSLPNFTGQGLDYRMSHHLPTCLAQASSRDVLTKFRYHLCTQTIRLTDVDRWLEESMVEHLPKIFQCDYKSLEEYADLSGERTGVPMRWDILGDGIEGTTLIHSRAGDGKNPVMMPELQLRFSSAWSVFKKEEDTE